MPCITVTHASKLLCRMFPAMPTHLGDGYTALDALPSRLPAYQLRFALDISCVELHREYQVTLHKEYHVTQGPYVCPKMLPAPITEDCYEVLDIQ